MDGQHSLWDCAAFSVGGGEDSDVVEVLDLLRGGLREQAIAQHEAPPQKPEEKGFFSTFFKKSRTRS